MSVLRALMLVRADLRRLKWVVVGHIGWVVLFLKLRRLRDRPLLVAVSFGWWAGMRFVGYPQWFSRVLVRIGYPAGKSLFVNVWGLEGDGTVRL